MATDTAVDFATRDFIDTDDGAWSETEDSRTAVLLQLEGRLGEWWGDPLAGSRIAALREGSDPIDAETLRDVALLALQELVDAAIISDLTIEIDTDEGGRAVLLLNYRDLTTGTPVDVAYSPWGGSP